VLPAALDEVSAAISALFGAHGQAYQAASAQALAFQEQFVQLLGAGANAYANAEANIVQVLKGVVPTSAQAVTPAAVLQSIVAAAADPPSFLNLGLGNQGGLNLGSGNIGNLNLGSGNIGNLNLGSGNLNGNLNLGSGNHGGPVSVPSNFPGSPLTITVPNTFNVGSGNIGSLNLGSGNFGSFNLGSGNGDARHLILSNGNVGSGNIGSFNLGGGNRGPTVVVGGIGTTTPGDFNLKRLEYG
jgi:hypothetical protein